MIRKILTTYAARLDEYLARSHRQPEGVAEVGLIGSAGEQCPNKLVVSLVNLEREASGDGGYMQRAATGYAGTFIQSLPRFEVGNESYTLELVPMSTTDLHNIWTTMGGQYYPSFICKVRGLTVDSAEIMSGSRTERKTQDLHASFPCPAMQMGIPAGAPRWRQP